MGNIYLLQAGDKLVGMAEQAYDSERRLQEFISKYPSLLASDQINSQSPPLLSDHAGFYKQFSENESFCRWLTDTVFRQTNA